MKERLYERLYLFYSGVLGLYIINLFLEKIWLAHTVGFLAMVMLAVSFGRASKLFRILGSAFIVSGLIMYISSGLPFYRLPLFLTSNMPLLAFLMLLPWINSVVHVGKYDQQINGLMKENVDNLGSLYYRSLFTTYILMTFLNLSAVNLSQGVLLKSMKNVNKTVRDIFISKTTVRAFALALIWSPMEVIVAITVDATGVSYLTYLPWLVFISFIALALDAFVGRYRFKGVPFEAADPSTAPPVPLKKIVQQILKLFFALSLFLTTVLTISRLFDLNFILAVTLVILPFSSLWAILIKRWYLFRVFGFEVWKARTNHMQNFVILFISLAFFTNSLSETGMVDYVQRPFLMFNDYPVVILTLILVTYLLMAMIGVHPIGTIAILLEVLTPLFDVFNPAGIGIVLIVGALATASSGTYGVTVTMTSMNTQQNPYRITLRNLPFTLFFGSIGILIALIII
ncbi:hypothetical protein CR194_18960 [Salipaludibacillus keqinensis]|uniref:Citrate transporter-like domain-containing protein n=1 Tax=Salipaludibacillus keqinensis TaxID=2045207 RepID=A0A323T9A0_9BACI|nr:hypothetical protein [Salipaludibacillus keqinensis]PYZ91706.1 hypothetical protein CR194_18960 [Salipaludibacillus keqinensis]